MFRHNIRSLVSKFFEDSKEIEVDAVASCGRVLALAVVEHVENAGVHSGDATLVIPPQRTFPEVIRNIEKITARIAESLTLPDPSTSNISPRAPTSK